MHQSDCIPTIHVNFRDTVCLMCELWVDLPQHLMLQWKQHDGQRISSQAPRSFIERLSIGFSKNNNSFLPLMGNWNLQKWTNPESSQRHNHGDFFQSSGDLSQRKQPLLQLRAKAQSTSTFEKDQRVFQIQKPLNPGNHWGCNLLHWAITTILNLQP